MDYSRYAAMLNMVSSPDSEARGQLQRPLGYCARCHRPGPVSMGRRFAPPFSGLGLDIQELGDELDVLNHSLVPFGGSPTYLSRVASLTQARNYASAGFHVCVIRGLAGGCGDPANDTLGTQGTGSRYECDDKKNRDDLKTAWAKAASAYLNVYQALGSGMTVAAAKQALGSANGTADSAYGAEGVDPPVEPVFDAVIAPTPPPAAPQKAGFPGWAVLLVGGGIGLIALASKKKKPASMMMGYDDDDDDLG